jgi:uncharacterized repeat protein (TIGR01451 family)
VATDSLGNVYLADSTTIREVSNGTITTIAGTSVGGDSPDGTLAVNAMIGNYLAGLAVDSHQNVYISDLFNQRVRKITASTGILSTVAGNGMKGYTGDGKAATSAELQNPAGLALDANGNLYIADNGNCRVRRVSATDGTISTIAGNGTCGSTGDSQPATSAELYYPSAVALDGNGNLYIATADNRIRKVSGGNITTIAGTGTAGYFGDGGPATSAQLNNPSGLAVDSAGNIYIGDFGNSAVRVLQPLAEPLLTVSSTHSGIFAEDASGTFTITASNAAQAAATNGTVTVTASLPANLTPVSMTGNGWSCSIASLSCSTSGSSFSPITLTVNTPGGPTQVTNQVTVSNQVPLPGVGSLSLGSAAEDAVFIGSGTPLLEVSATHAGDFVLGQQGTFTITVGNQLYAVDTSTTVTVVDTLPPGLSLVSMGGTGWNCNGTTCTTNAPLAGGASYSPIVGTVSVSSNAGSPLTNKATASGGGSTTPAVSTDTIVVVSSSPCQITANSSVTVADVQAIVNQGLGASKANNDVNRDGVVNVVDIQIVINAALYQSCTP